jgi:hypothetical protein
MRQHPAAVPIPHRRQIHPMAGHGDVGDASAQTWLARSVARLRSAYGNTGCAECAGCFLLVLSLRYSEWMPMRSISVATCRHPTSTPGRRSRSRSMRLPAYGAKPTR